MNGLDVDDKGEEPTDDNECKLRVSIVLVVSRS